MTPRPRICVLQVPPFDPARALGGAEVMAVELVRALTAVGQVTVLHGVAEDADRGPRRFTGLAAEVHGAFPLDDYVREHGHIRPRLDARGAGNVEQADIIVTVERSLDLPSRAARVVTLGGVGYPHTVEVLAHRAWDTLVVPSQFVADQVRARAPHARGVTVVANGVDTDLFRPSDKARASTDHLRLLVASRPTWDKGLLRVFDLARDLQGLGLRPRVVCFTQPGGYGPNDFFRKATRAGAGLDLEILPWRTRDLMADAYRSAHLTLCLGDAEEGFGLVAAESVATGTPVLATPAGFLRDMLPPEHGLVLVEPDASAPDLVTAARCATRLGPDACRTLGRPYVARHYGLSRMRAELARVVQLAAG